MRIIFVTIFIIVVFLISTFTIYSGSQKLFTSFTIEAQQKNFYIMNKDSRFYWFGGMLGSSSLRYDSVSGEFYEFDFNRGNTVESVSSIEIINDQVWFGLTTFGIAIYDFKKRDFIFYGSNNGLNYYTYTDGEKYSKVTSIAFDEYTNRVWVGLIRAGLSYYDGKNKWGKVDDPLIRGISVYSIDTNESIVAVAGDKGLYYLDKKREKWNLGGNISDNTKFYQVFIDNDSIICNATTNNKGQVLVYKIDEKRFNIVFEWKAPIDRLQKFKNYLVLASRYGVTFYNLDTKMYKTFNTSYGLPTNWVNYIYFDKEDMWVLTQKGICRAKIKDVLKELEDIN